MIKTIGNSFESLGSTLVALRHAILALQGPSARPRSRLHGLRIPGFRSPCTATRGR